MANKTAPLLPATEQLLQQLGERLRLARLRRQLTAKQVAERAGMALMTLRSVERGGSGVTIGAYLAVMQVLGVERDLAQLAQADPLGREIQDARLPSRVRPASRPREPERAAPPKKTARKRHDAWQPHGEYTSSAQLAELIQPSRKRAGK